jgi:hypothetical protein
MRRTIQALILLLSLAPSAFAGKIIAQLGIAQQTVQSEVAVVGTVTSIENELAEIKAHPGAKETTGHTVAVVKVETTIRGLKNTTHVKVGFVKMAEASPQKELIEDFRDNRIQNLHEKGQYLLFLQKHAVGNFYVFTYQTPPLLITDAEKQTGAIAEAKLAAGAIADPMKALKAEKAQDRALAAMVLLQHYRLPAQRGEVDRVAIDADENAAILKAIAEGDWTIAVTGYTRLSSAIQHLAISPIEGWAYPTVKAGENVDLVYQKAFQDWLAGPGAKYRFQKFVAKKK